MKGSEAVWDLADAQSASVSGGRHAKEAFGPVPGTVCWGSVMNESGPESRNGSGTVQFDQRPSGPCWGENYF